MTYRAPVNDILFSLDVAGGLSDMIDSDLLAGVDRDLITQVVEEAGRFAMDRLAELNWKGDRTGAKLKDGVVSLPDGWKAAYQAWTEAGWSALPCPVEYGGQGLPHTVSSAVGEIWNSANLAFGLAPLLTQGAIDALHVVGSDEIKQIYLPRMISGEWTGTMNLTEPHAGSDLGALRTKAERQGDGSYRISGTKIFITYGEHELTENIIHMVLARLPDAPAGTRGISLFLVPKFLVNADGSLGARNDVKCIGLEEKLGIHASPTCVMSYGEKGGAIGYLLGEENRGLNAMFIMMNAARLAVGVQGVALAERATQHALSYANERRQGRAEGAPEGEMSPIIEHADVRRNIMTMKAMTSASRAICLATARELDISERTGDAEIKSLAAARAALLTPVAKAFSTDIGVEIASIGVQIHGGMGFIEETGAAQYYRDARILPIYEGTNGIQAIDLVMRKLPLGDGKVVAGYIAELKATVEDVKSSNNPAFGDMAACLEDAIDALETATRFMIEKLGSEREQALAGAQPYLRLFGLASGGTYLARGALKASREANPAHAHHISLARYFAENHVVDARGLERAATRGGPAILDAAPEIFAI